MITWKMKNNHINIDIPMIPLLLQHLLNLLSQLQYPMFILPLLSLSLTWASSLFQNRYFCKVDGWYDECKRQKLDVKLHKYLGRTYLPISKLSIHSSMKRNKSIFQYSLSSSSQVELGSFLSLININISTQHNTTLISLTYAIIQNVVKMLLLMMMIRDDHDHCDGVCLCGLVAEYHICCCCCHATTNELTKLFYRKKIL